MTYAAIALNFALSFFVLAVITGFIASFLHDVFQMEWTILIPVVSTILCLLSFAAAAICAIWGI